MGSRTDTGLLGTPFFPRSQASTSLWERVVGGRARCGCMPGTVVALWPQQE